MKLQLHKLLVIFFTVVFVTSVISYSFIVALYRHSIFDTEVKYVNKLVVENANKINDMIKMVINSLYALTNRKDLSMYIDGSDAYKCINMDNVISKLDDLIRYYPIIQRALVATPNGQITHDSIGKNITVNQYMALIEIIDQDIIRNTNHSYINLVEVISLQDGISDILIRIPVQSYKLSSNKINGFCYIVCSIDDILLNILTENWPYALHDANSVIYKNEYFDVDDNVYMSTTDYVIDISNKSYIIHNAAIGYSGLHLSLAYPKENLNTKVDDFTRWSLLLFSVFLICEAFFSVAIYFSIINPIKEISQQVCELKSLDRRINNPANNRNELNELVIGINHMLVRTNRLTKQMHETELNLLMERNLYLQAQINPHFLYNMFECICGMAAQTNNNAIRDLTSHLAAMYRYSIDGQEATIEDEIGCIKVFYHIVRIRYDEPYEFIFDIPDYLYDYTVPRMILEPLIENAIQHGFIKGTGKAGIIKIHATQKSETSIVITVSDNGSGISTNTLNAINQELNKYDETRKNCCARIGIGLSNVNNRIKLRYGSDSGLILKANAYGGIDTIMTIVYES